MAVSLAPHALGLALLPLIPTQGGDFNPRRVPELAGAFETVFELADSDGNGQVTRSELSDLRFWLEGFGQAQVKTVMAELVLQGINRDGLMDWTDHDLAASLEALDVDGNGSIERGEPSLEVLCKGAMGTRGVINRIGHEVLLEEADGDGDGAVSAAEITALKGRWAGRPIKSVAADWVANAKQREPANRNRMAPGVAFFTLEAELDQNRDGLLDLDRVYETFERLDADGSGVLTLEERRRDGWKPPVESWRRPSAARLRMPALMPWQRSLEDALAVQKRTGQALLLCVNMDGETACDSLASWRYRDPEFAEIAAGYVCLVVSPDDHQPRDYDDRGRRLVSPRLGRVTDREHIDLEPTLFERYFNERRVAPRHVGVDVDGTILFDLYLLTDPTVLDAGLAEHSRPVEMPDWGALSTAELAQYPDASAREEMERRMLEGDAATRLEIASLAGSMPEAGMIGLRDGDESVRRATALALAAAGDSLDVLQRTRLMEAAAQLDEATRALVVSALMPVVEGNAYGMASLASLEPGARISGLGDLGDWRGAALLSTLPTNFARSRDAALSALEALDGRVDPAEASPSHSLVRANALLDLAHSFAARAEDPRDAAAECVKEARRGASASPARAQAMIASASTLAGDFGAAVRSARAALPELWSASSDPLSLYALQALRTGGTQLIYASLKAGRPVPSSLVADAMLAGRTLVAHSAGVEADATQLLDLAGAVGDVALLDELALECVTRFPGSADLHQRYRNRVLVSRGGDAMSGAYDALDASVTTEGYGPTLSWFRGLAMLVAAEWEVQQAGLERARASYDASLAAFGAAVDAEPSFADSANHYRVLGGAAAAALAARAGEADRARELLETFGRLRPASLDLKDGLGVTPREYAAEVLQATQDAEGSNGGSGGDAEPQQAPREGREKAGG